MGDVLKVLEILLDMDVQRHQAEMRKAFSDVRCRMSFGGSSWQFINPDAITISAGTGGWNPNSLTEPKRSGWYGSTGAIGSPPATTEGGAGGAGGAYGRGVW